MALNASVLDINDVLDNQIQKTNKADLDGLLDSIETSQGECSLVATVY